MKKITIEIPEYLLSQVEIRAAQQKKSVQDFLILALRLALQRPTLIAKKKRTDFPLIRGLRNAPLLTDEQVDTALITD